MKIAEKDRFKDRSGLLAQLELEKRSRAHGITDGLLIVHFMFASCF